MRKKNIIDYEDWLLKKEAIIRLAFVLDIIVLAGAVIAYASQRNTMASILLPLIIASGLYALVNRAELKHIATIKRCRGLDQTNPQPGNTSTLHCAKRNQL